MAHIIIGLDRLNVKLDKLKNANSEKAMADACLLIERSAKEKCPTGDTGILRDSITSEYNAKEGRIGTNLEYAPYVHQGTGIYAVNGDGRSDVPWTYFSETRQQFYTTSGQQPQPFLTDAFEENKKEIKELFANAIKEAI